MSLSTVNIYPIFDQSIGQTWERFAEITWSCMRQSYPGTSYDKHEINMDIDLMKDSWNTQVGNFAFGAYNANNEIIGFTNGYVDGATASIERLYVLPQYQRKNIGTRLLRAAEHAATISAKRVELIPLSKSHDFYSEHSGYARMENGFYGRNIQPAKCETLPVVHAHDKNVRNIASFIEKHPSRGTPKYTKKDIRTIIQLHVPVFIWVDISSQINGVAIQNPAKKAPKDTEIYSQYTFLFCNKLLESAIRNAR